MSVPPAILITSKEMENKMNCKTCKVSVANTVVIGDGYYNDIATCDKDECIGHAEGSLYSLCDVVPLAEYPAENVKYLEHA